MLVMYVRRQVMFHVLVNWPLIFVR